MQNTSKYKLITGKVINSKFEDFKLNEISSEGQLMYINSKFIASLWEGAGACISILDKTNPHRVKHDIPLIRAHLQNVNDVRFSPFIPNLLSTSSDDGTIKLWQIPDQGLTVDIDTPVQKYDGHSKKVILSQYHPCSRDILASCSFDNSIHIWNIENGKSYCKLSTNDIMSSLDWNYNGSLIGTITKEKLVYVFDPRSGAVPLKFSAHESGKTQKMCWVDPNYFITTGFGKGNVREIKLYDIRDTVSAVSSLEIDHQTGVMYPWFDYDTGVIYIPSKGEAMLYFYEFSNGQIAKLNEFKTNDRPKSFSFVEKRFCDYKKNEMTMMFRYKENNLSFVSVYVPRKDGFDQSLWPETFSGESSITGEEWIKGENRERIKKNIEEVAGRGESEVVKIVKKESKVIEEPLEVQVEKLKDEVAKLKSEITKKDEINEQLRKEIDNLKDLLSKK